MNPAGVLAEEIGQTFLKVRPEGVTQGEGGPPDPRIEAEKSLVEPLGAVGQRRLVRQAIAAAVTRSRAGKDDRGQASSYPVGGPVHDAPHDPPASAGARSPSSGTSTIRRTPGVRAT